MRYVVLGDGQSPHLLKWISTLAQVGGPELELSVVSSRGLLPGIEALIPQQRCLLLHTRPDAAGGNASLLLHLPRVAAWLKRVQPDVLHAHYLSSHGTLAWLAQALWWVKGTLVTSAWGSDVLLTPRNSRIMRRLTVAVLSASALSTSDSEHMADEMRALGARRIRVFPFGLPALPRLADDQEREPGLFFSNRGLEPIYRIDRVLRLFARVADRWPQARLVVANQGGLRSSLQSLAASLKISSRVEFVGLLNPQQQAAWYDRAQWHVSLPESDSVSVSVLEAMAHGCIPLLSDLPANRELIDDGRNGLILPIEDGDAHRHFAAHQADLMERAASISRSNRAWVAEHGLFPPHVQAFLAEVAACRRG